MKRLAEERVGTEKTSKLAMPSTASSEINRMTQWLPRELCEALIRKLRPGQRYPLRQLPEFAPLLDSVTEVEQKENGVRSRYLRNLDETDDEIMCALLEGDLPLLERLLQTSGKEVPEGAAWMAASTGRLASVKWAIDKGSKWSLDGCLPVPYALWRRNAGRTKNNREDYFDVMRWAARGGYLELAKWALAHGCPLLYDPCTCAAKGGHISLLQWLRENGCDWDKRTSAAAAEHGHLELLRWAVENGCPCDEAVCGWLARRGQLAGLQWALARGLPSKDIVCKYAARGGQFELLKWARDQGFSWDEETCAGAAASGDLRLLQWVRQSGCPWDANTIASAASEGHIEVMRWALDNGCPMDEDAVVEGIRGNQLEALKFLWERKCPWTEEWCVEAAEGRHQKIERWGHANGWPCSCTDRSPYGEDEDED